LAGIGSAIFGGHKGYKYYQRKKDESQDVRIKKNSDSLKEHSASIAKLKKEIGKTQI